MAVFLWPDRYSLGNPNRADVCRGLNRCRDIHRRPKSGNAVIPITDSSSFYNCTCDMSERRRSDQTWKSYGASIATIGVGGTAYSIWIWRRMTTHGLAASIDAFDRIWYAARPGLTYGSLTLAGGSFTLAEIPAFDGLQSALSYCFWLGSETHGI